MAWAILSKLLPHISFRVFTLNWSYKILVDPEENLSASLLFLLLSPFNQIYQPLILSLIFFAIFSIYPILIPTKHTLKTLKVGRNIIPPYRWAVIAKHYLLVMLHGDLSQSYKNQYMFFYIKKIV